MQENFLSEQLKISIIVPVYNSEKYLTRCLKSLINQTYKNIEIIIINDGSTDNSLEILKKFASEDDRIVLYNKKNEGVSKTRNYGIRISTGNYIMFVDSDDYISLNTVKELVDIIIKYKEIDLVKFAYDARIGFWIKDRQECGCLNNKIFKKKQIKDMIFSKIISTYYFSNITNCLISKKISKDLDLFLDENLAYAEDFDYQFKLLNVSESIYITNNIYYHYMQNIDSAVFSLDIDKLVNQLECEIEIVTRICNKIGYWIDGYDRINKRIYHILYAFLLLSKNYKEYIEMTNNILENPKYIEFLKKITIDNHKEISEYVVKEQSYIIKKIIGKIKRKLKNFITSFLI